MRYGGIPVCASCALHAWQACLSAGLGGCLCKPVFGHTLSSTPALLSCMLPGSAASSDPPASGYHTAFIRAAGCCTAVLVCADIAALCQAVIGTVLDSQEVGKFLSACMLAGCLQLPASFTLRCDTIMLPE